MIMICKLIIIFNIAVQIIGLIIGRGWFAPLIIGIIMNVIFIIILTEEGLD